MFKKGDIDKRIQITLNNFLYDKKNNYCCRNKYGAFGDSL